MPCPYGCGKAHEGRRMPAQRIFIAPRRRGKIQHIGKRNSGSELAEERAGGQLSGLDSQNIDLRGTDDVRGVIWRARIQG
jgi:hypothetical protein